MKLKNIILALGLVAAVAVPTYRTAVPVAAMNNIGTNTRITTEEGTCAVYINAYCTTTNSFIDKVPCRILDSSGQYLSFNYFLGRYSISPYGGQSTLYTDETGGLTVELPIGQYTLVTDNVGEYSVESLQMPFTIYEGMASKNIDVEYVLSSGSIALSFSDEDGKALSGCTLQVEDSNGNPVNFFAIGNNYSYVTSAGKTTLTISSSSVSLSDFPTGNYTVRVITPPTGMIPSMESYPLDITNGNTVSINIQFTPESSGQLSIANIDTAGNILTGSACSIVGTDNVMLSFTKEGTEYKYDPNGTINTITFESTDPIFISGLPLNKEYTVNEVNNSPGYVLSDPQKVTPDGKDTITVLLTTKKTSGSLSITTTDDTTNEKVADYVYNLFSSPSKTPMYFSLKDPTANNSAYVYDDQGEITAIKTSASGAVTIEGLPSGDIIVQCKEAPSGYIMDTSEITKTITPNTTTLLDLTVSKSNVAIEVVDENESPIIDVSVEIYNEDGRIIMTGQTNAKGKILLTNVASGSYTYRISAVPEGYSYIDDMQSFTITPAGTAEGLSKIRLSKTKIQVSIGKQEGNNTLENAVFVLYDAAGNEVSRALTSSSGIASFTGVGYGNYTIKQITAPIGYTVSDKELNISIDKTYKNENVFDFSADGSASFEDDTGEDDEKKDNKKKEDENSESSSVSIGDIYFIIIGILVVGFVIVAIVSFVLKVKNGDNDEAESSNTDNDHSAKEAPIYVFNDKADETKSFTSPSQNIIDEEGVKIYTPASNRDDVLAHKSPEELKKMEEEIRALIASQTKAKEEAKGLDESTEVGKEKSADERDN